MITLSDGRQIKPDMTKVTIREYRALFADERTQEKEDELLARIYGLSAEELLDLPYPDYRLLLQGFFDAARNPVDADPN